MKTNLHVISGAGGTTANALSHELQKNKQSVVLVSRRPVKTNAPNTVWKKADLLHYDQVLSASAGAAVIYICNGLGYKNIDWITQWPIIMQNVINVAKQLQARVIFFDNIYMYGRVTGPMTEETAYNPLNKKGEVRAMIATQFMDEIHKKNISGAIGRAPGLYGTDSMQSVLDSLVFNNLAADKKAKWFGNPRYLHNFAYMPDMGHALGLLGQSKAGDGQIWHLPTSAPLSGIDFIELAARIYQTTSAYTKINKTMLKIMGLFSPGAHSQVDMFYSWEQDYNFVSAKFESEFNIKPTAYKDAFRDLSMTLYKKGV